MTSTEVRIRRGTTDQHAAFTGAQGELTMDTDLNTLLIHDGVTAGGLTIGLESGTVALFHQSAAPTGWTKDTTTLNDHAIRILSSDAWSSGSKGSTPFSTVFSTRASEDYALLAADLPSTSHSHTMDFSTGNSGAEDHQINGGANGTTEVNYSTTADDPTAGVAAGHAHTQPAMTINYCNMIKATKN